MRVNYITSNTWLKEGKPLCRVEEYCELGGRARVLDMGAVIYMGANRHLRSSYLDMDCRGGLLWGENFTCPKRTYHGTS